jgi:hypothetical protein
VKTANKTATTPAPAEKQLKGFISRFEQQHQALIRVTRRALRRRLPPLTSLESAATLARLEVKALIGAARRPSTFCGSDSVAPR